MGHLKDDRDVNMIMAEKKRVLIYSDCHIFSGSEYVVVNILKNKALKKKFDFCFAYRCHPGYEKEIGRLFSDEEKKNFFPLKVLSNVNWSYSLNKIIKWRFARLPLKAVLMIPEYLSFFNIYNYFIIKKAFKEIQPDLAHINNGGYPAAESCLVASKVCKDLGIKNVLQLNNIPAKKQKKYWDPVIKKSVDGFIIASEYTSKALSGIRNITNNNIYTLKDNVPEPVINRGAEEIRRELKLTEERAVFIEVALFEERKGQMKFLEALVLLRNKHPEFYSNMTVLFIGSGPDETKMRKYIKDNELNSHIIFLGFRNDYVDYMNAADVAVLPSLHHEDMPLVNMTAMALKKPVVSTYLAGIPEEVEDEKTGLLIDPKDENFAEKLADALIVAYNKKNSFGIEGRKKYQKEFSLESYTRGLQDIYEKMITNCEV